MKQQKYKVMTTPNNCKACGLCVGFCPKKAISFSQEINSAGNNFTVIDHDLCIRCGICYEVCPDYVYETVLMELVTANK